MARSLRRTPVLLALGVGVLLAAAPAPAQAVTVGDCTATPMRPERVSTTGARISASIACTPAPPPGFHALEIEFTLWGDDAVGDDRLGILTHGANVPPAQRLRTSRNIRCDEDPVGNDELYARIRLRVQTTGGGPYTAWSPSQRTATVSVDCD